MFEHDERDGRERYGNVAHNHKIYFNVKPKESKEFYIVYSTEKINETAEKIIDESVEYRKQLIKTADMNHDIANMLVKSANQFVVKRESTKVNRL